MVALGDGHTFELDGHARALLWPRGQLPVPRQLLVRTFTAPDLGAALMLRQAIDGAARTRLDQVFGIAREHGLLDCPAGHLIPNGACAKAAEIVAALRQSRIMEAVDLAAMRESCDGIDALLALRHPARASRA